jgi:hypothetical protein
VVARGVDDVQVTVCRGSNLQATRGEFVHIVATLEHRCFAIVTHIQLRHDAATTLQECKQNINKPCSVANTDSNSRSSAAWHCVKAAW